MVRENTLIENILELSNANGVSGFEKDVVHMIQREVEDLGEIRIDKMNNLILERKENSGKLRVLLDAHTDEVGFMVQAILHNGQIRVQPLGCWDIHNLVSNLAKIITREGKEITGIFASKPPHYEDDDDRNKKQTWSKLTFDLGTSSREETLALGVNLGDPIVCKVSASFDEERGLFLGKAFDCRSGCANIIQVLKELKGEELQVDLIASFTAQEETGVRGIEAAFDELDIDLAIVFEGCPADDSFPLDCPPQTALGKGPMLRHMDAGMITHPGFQRFALDLANKANLPVQEAVRTGGMTNGHKIHTKTQAIPTIVIGVPVRYAHAHHGYSTLYDHQKAVELALEIIRNLNQKVYDAL